jgi:phosphoserine aminotransferase
MAALRDAAPSLMGTSHRRDPVRSVVRRVREGLASLFSLPDGYEVLLGNGGASAFWDAAVFCLIEHRSEHLVFGEFSSKFASAVKAAPHLEQPLVIESPPGSHPAPVAHESIDAYALTHNETSTGVSMAVTRPALEGLVLVDATSGAGALAVDPAAFDAYYFSPQKAFGADGALWMACCSPAAVARIEATGRWVPQFLDLRIALTESRRDQTYNTPAIGTLVLLADQVEWLLAQGGLRWTAARGEEAAGHVYGWAEASQYARPFVPDPAMRSRTVATIDLDPSVPAGSLTAALRANGIVDLEGYRKLHRNQIRIAMFPNIDLADLEILTAAIDWIAERL